MPTRELTLRCPPRKFRLTPRMVQVVQMLADDWQPGGIAGRLGISIWTVRSYIHRMQLGLGIVNSAGLVAHALRKGIIQ